MSTLNEFRFNAVMASEAEADALHALHTDNFSEAIARAKHAIERATNVLHYAENVGDADTVWYAKTVIRDMEDVIENAYDRLGNAAIGQKVVFTPPRVNACVTGTIVKRLGMNRFLVREEGPSAWEYEFPFQRIDHGRSV